jgi:hypothetical protein
MASQLGHRIEHTPEWILDRLALCLLGRFYHVRTSFEEASDYSKVMQLCYAIPDWSDVILSYATRFFRSYGETVKGCIDGYMPGDIKYRVDPRRVWRAQFFVALLPPPIALFKQNFESLRYLLLDRVNFRSVRDKNFANMQRLEHLYLRGCVGVRHCNFPPKLRTLEMHGISSLSIAFSARDEAWRLDEDTLPKNLESLFIASWRIENPMVLAHQQRLVHLVIDDCCLDRWTASTIFDHLPPTLETICLSGNEFGDVGALTLAKNAVRMPDLHIVDVRWNRVGKVGYKALSKVVEVVR